MKTLTTNDIPSGAAYSAALVPLGSGLWARIECKHDESMGEPWEEHDGHGPVSEARHHPFGWGTRPEKRAGQRLLYWDRGQYRLYDFAAAMKQAKAEGWGIGADAKAALAAKLGREPTAGEVTAAAVEHDFKHLQAWCEDRWQWIGVCVSLEDADGNELGADSLWGTESSGEYWREEAAGMVNRLAEAHAAEATERAYWEAREVVTA